MLRQLMAAGTISAALLLGGCSSTMQAAKVDATGRFPTTNLLAADAVKTVVPFDAKYRPLLYVKMDDGKTKDYAAFYLESFRNMNAFTQVSQKSDIEALILQRKLVDQVPNVSDLIGLNRLQQAIGPFLVVEPYVEWKGGYDFIASIKAIDPATGETVLLLEQKAFNWAGLDKPLFYPLLNGFLDWTQGKTITTAPPKGTPAKKQ